MSFGLEGLARLRNTKTRSISPENPTGAAGGGALEEPGGEGPASELGRGWKVRPSITLAPGSTTTLCDIEGPGTIQHIWLTTSLDAYRGCILRCYWDGEAEPSVEVPLGDFFANGHGVWRQIDSIAISSNPSGGLNSYWPMPFRQRCRVTVENQRDSAVAALYYQVTYELGPVPDDVAYFHAQWRRSTTPARHPEHTLLDGVRGRGHYVGTYLAWTSRSEGWWGEGEIKFYMDGDTESPTICGTGTEDYFGGAWSFGGTYSGPFLGYPMHAHLTPPPLQQHGMYRWHIPDPIRFERDLRVTIQALGWTDAGKFLALEDDIASVAYWYQAEPHGSFPALPGLAAREPE